MSNEATLTSKGQTTIQVAGIYGGLTIIGESNAPTVALPTIRSGYVRISRAAFHGRQSVVRPVFSRTRTHSSAALDTMPDSLGTSNYARTTSLSLRYFSLNEQPCALGYDEAGCPTALRWRAFLKQNGAFWMAAPWTLRSLSVFFKLHGRMSKFHAAWRR